MERGGWCELVVGPSTIKLRFGAVFVYRMLKEKILGQKKPASYGGTRSYGEQ
ncbi:hypothetical protein ACVXG9_06255 [Escherichia coli]